MDDVHEPNPHDAAIPETERERVFVTMNATFKDEATCRAAMETIVSDAHAAPGVTSHHWFRSDDGSSLFVVEQYENKTALSKAVRRFTRARISFFRSIDVVDVSVYGDASLGTKVAFSLLRPTHMNYFDGYSKPVAAMETGIQDVERDRVFIATNATFEDDAAVNDLAARSAERTHAEAGIGSHFWARNDRALFVLEQYANESELVAHLRADTSSRAALHEAADVRDVTVYGARSDAVTAMLAPLDPTYMTYYGGYSK